MVIAWPETKFITQTQKTALGGTKIRVLGSRLIKQTNQQKPIQQQQQQQKQQQQQQHKC